MFCSVVTKNSNWEILTKNLARHFLVTFKIQDRVKDDTERGLQKNLSFQGRGGHEIKNNIWGLGQFVDGGGWCF